MTVNARIEKLRRTLPQRITRVRNDRTQRQFARDLGVFQQNVNRYEHGLSAPHVDFLISLALRENISLDWLLLGEGAMKRRRA